MPVAIKKCEFFIIKTNCRFHRGGGLLRVYSCSDVLQIGIKSRGS